MPIKLALARLGMMLWWTSVPVILKRRKVAVVGKLRLNEWTGRDGHRRSRLQVVADAVQFLGSPKKANDPDGGGHRDLP